MLLFRRLGAGALLCATLYGQYKTESAGAPPAEATAVAPALVKDGIRILKPDGSVLCEIWLAAVEPKGGGEEQNTTWTGVPHGALLGVVRAPGRWSDRRGQTIKPGIYTMRYSFFPMNGDHQGVEPQRDFALLSPAAVDTGAAAQPGFDALMEMSRKASGTPHPLVLSLWKDEPGAAAGVEAAGDANQVLHTKIGAAPVAIIVVGKTEH
ncbi:MAG: hypothetical protein HY858_03805 [Candidatus Solibacter usitatus]|nr:hypothetical protein [Candidatus Solibacter usitatus]